jgi:hypothetical protein
MTVDAALDIARSFGPIWPQTPQKTGYRGTNGSRDATRDEKTIRGWCATYRDAVFALMTGEISGVIGLDIDIKNERNGLDSLEWLGISSHPATVTAHTPSGGIHCLFRRPNYPIQSSLDRLGPGLEVKGEGAWITLPPGPGRFWDPHLGKDTALAVMPEWMVIAEPVRPAASKPAKPETGLSRYAEKSLDSACRKILAATAGEQEATLNGECFAIGTLAGAGGLPADFARRALIWTARQIPSHDPLRRWRPSDLERKVERAFADGLRHPREVRHA